MIKLYIFDMGGVVVRDHNIAPALLPYLGFREQSFSNLIPEVLSALHRHSQGTITETEFWEVYKETTGNTLPEFRGSLLGKFFKPRIHMPTITVLKELRQKGKRIICGTNVIDSHYKIHMKNGDYQVFDKVYPSHHLHKIKPDLSFYKSILNSEKVTPDEVFFTDDLEKNVHAGKQVGINSFLYTDADNLRKQIASIED